ncbi:hypothetical protein MNBD_GAMMA24-1903 [hydrothermal vent metagenome]|uniref:Uncharacterized protein n=1 Tax=hydrothermal vent metagenome TaxID=652676 RepID=A0A3B1B476_9ZZZZ
MPPQPFEKIINRKLLQKTSSNGEIRCFEILNDHFIRAKKNNLLGEQSYTLKLNMLQPWPVHQQRFSCRWMMSLIYFALTLLAYGVFIFLHPDAQILQRLLPFVIILLLLSLGSLLMFIYHSPNVMEFHSRYGNCALLHILHNKPSKKECRKFTDELKTRILLTSQDANLDKKQMLEFEREELTRLFEEGVIGKENHAAAIKRIEQIKI